MTELKARLKVMPVHAFVMIFAALYSFASIFIPMFELFVQYVPYRTYSLFSLLLNPRVFTRIRSGSVDLNFQSFAAWAFVITIVLAVAALTLSLSYPFYYNSSKKRKIGYFSVLVGAGEHVGILLDEFGNCDDVALGDILVAIEVGRE